MKKSTTKFSRKIQLHIDLPDVEQRQAALRILHQWQKAGFRAANNIISDLFLQEVVKDRHYSVGQETEGLISNGDKLREDQEPANMESGFFPEIVKRFQDEIPHQILEGINRSITRNFYKEKLHYLEGRRSLKSYNKNLPLPFNVECIKGFHFDKKKKAFCFSLFSVPFRTYLGRDVADKKIFLDQFQAGDVSMGSTRLQINNNKLYLLVVFELETEDHDLRPDVVAEARLSPDFVFVVNIGEVTQTIGTKEEFMFRKLAIQAAYKRSEDGVTYARSGKGKKRKTKALTRLQEWEHSYVHHRMHSYSLNLIDFCIQHKAGILVLVNEPIKGTHDPEEPLLLKDWDYYDVTNKIQEKAMKAGVEIVSEPVAVY